MTTLEELKNKDPDELFYFVGNDIAESEKIVAPRYSYWKSVFRVFFRKKINIVILTLLALILFVSFVMPAVWKFNAFENVQNASMFNKSPSQAMEMTGGFSLKWMLGSGNHGESIFYGIVASSQVSLLLAIICAAINM